MLQSHDPLAMALVARMLVMLNEIDYAWSANGRGEYEVVEQDVRGISQLMPNELRWTMDRSCRVLEREILLCRQSCQA